MNTVVALCFNVPGSYINVGSLNTSIVWIYYIFYGLATYGVRQRQIFSISEMTHGHQSLFSWSRRTRLVVQVSIALLIVLATGTAALATQPDGRFTV